MLTVEEMVIKAANDKASDIHILCGLPPKYRLDGKLCNMIDECLTVEDCLDIAKYLAGDGYDRFDEIGELDLSGDYGNYRCRVHIFKQQGLPSVALRILSEDIPELEDLGLPKTVVYGFPPNKDSFYSKEIFGNASPKKQIDKQGLDRVPPFAELQNGLVLVTGETGSGKSTTLAAILEKINQTRQAHIVTLEDPIEYIYRPKQCVINQREVGKDTKTFASGLRASLREDPDVILIGEMRDPETIEAAITAAETGHLVFATLHTNSAAETVDRIIQVFPEGKQAQIRLQLSLCLVAVLSQQLVPKKNGGRVLASELMIVNHAIANIIRAGKSQQLNNSFGQTEGSGNQKLDFDLIRLVREGKISQQEAVKRAREYDLVYKLSR